MIHPEEWVSTYGDYLFSLAFYKTGNKETAEDLVQDTFLSAIKAMEGFRDESSEKTWLVSILKNKINDYYRKKDVLKDTDTYLAETEQRFDASFFQEDGYSSAHWKTEAMPETWDAATDSKLNAAEFNLVLQHCIEKMPSKIQPVFIAKYMEEADSESICKEFNISASNYWVMIHRAKLLMRSCLEKSWFKTA